MDIRFIPIALAELQPTLQQYISAFAAPIDSFLEDHILLEFRVQGASTLTTEKESAYHW